MRKGFLYTQNTPAATWTIYHNLGRFPAAIKTIIGGVEWETDEECPDKNTIVITWATPQKGRVEIL